MKTAEDFRNEYPAMDDGFRCAVLRTLQDLEQEEVKPVKKKVSFGLVIALAVMLLGTVAVAASIGQWGLNEFWNRTHHWGSRTYIQSQSNPEASQAMRIAEDQPTITTPYGTITVREHAYDGIAVYLVMDVVPAEGVLLLPDSISSVHQPIPFAPELSHLIFSAKEFAEHLNRPEIVWFLPSAFLHHWQRGDAVFRDDGSATFMAQFLMEDWDEIQDSFTFYLDFLPYRNMPQDNITQGKSPSRYSTDFDIYHQIEFEIPLDYTPPLAIATSDPVDCEELGGFTASLTMIRTHITTYCLLQYPDRPLALEYFTKRLIKLLDENGQELTNGTWEGYVRNDERVLYTAFLNEIPDTVYLGYKELSPVPLPAGESIPFQPILTFHLTPQTQ